MPRLTRRYHFAASHRLVSPALSEDANRRLYGKCNYPFGHGHDYIVEVCVEGPVGEDGQIVNRRQMDQVVERQVLQLIDHKNLNLDVPEFEGAIPTTENLAYFIERRLRQGWNLEAQLKQIRIIETARNTFELEVSPAKTRRPEFEDDKK